MYSSFLLPPAPFVLVNRKAVVVPLLWSGSETKERIALNNEGF